VIAQYVRDHEPWEFLLVDNPGSALIPSWLVAQKVDGIIARIDSPLIARVVAACGIPTTDVCSGRLVRSTPWISADNTRIAELAADHLLQRGFKHLAYCGDDRLGWSR